MSAFVISRPLKDRTAWEALEVVKGIHLASRVLGIRPISTHRLEVPRSSHHHIIAALVMDLQEAAWNNSNTTHTQTHTSLQTYTHSVSLVYAVLNETLSKL